MRRIVIIACKIRESSPSGQMFSDYLVIIQTSKDTRKTNKWEARFYVNDYEKNVVKAMVNSGKMITFAGVSPII